MKSCVKIPDSLDCGDGWSRTWAWWPHHVADGKGFRWVWWERLDRRPHPEMYDYFEYEYRLPKKSGGAK